MAYATRAELTTYSLPTAALQGVSTERQDAALEAASREADGYLNKPFKLPLTAYGSDLKKAVCDIAALIIMTSRGFNPEMADANIFVAAAKTARAWLKMVSTGEIEPYGITDSSTSNMNAADDSSLTGPMVVQLTETTTEGDEFWSGETVSQGGSVGTPRRRGW